MASLADVFSVPPKRWVSNRSHDTWGYDFANAIEDETITGVAAYIYATVGRTIVADAVIEVAIDGTTATRINVEWDASDLIPQTAYRLEVVATLSSGADVVMLTDIVVV